MKIKCLDSERGGQDILTTHEVWVVENMPDSFQFVCPDFPLPSDRKKYFIGGRQIDVTIVRTDIEDGREVVYFCGTCRPQP